MWLSIDNKSSRPIYLQIILQIKEQLRRGELKTGDELPSVRELANSLSINMHTVRRAYLRLSEQGLLSLRLGRRATIASLPQITNSTENEAEISARLEEVITDALLMGLSSSAVHNLLEQQINNLENAKT
ncbi:MAG TPA: GntR family transcriptional regulator [Dehalococcoidales bacterium]|nr:GntR family transcriptional regulator [Dehalococcoidales bacterium]